jgi:hypothetical protein
VVDPKGTVKVFVTRTSACVVFSLHQVNPTAWSLTLCGVRWETCSSLETIPRPFRPPSSAKSIDFAYSP